MRVLQLVAQRPGALSSIRQDRLLAGLPLESQTLRGRGGGSDILSWLWPFPNTIAFQRSVFVLQGVYILERSSGLMLSLVKPF